MKRPDQYRIDPGEAGATDYKTMPQTGRGLDNTVELDRQKFAESEKEASEGPAPTRKPPPSRDANRSLREDEELERRINPTPGAAQTHADKENPFV